MTKTLFWGPQGWICTVPSNKAPPCPPYERKRKKRKKNCFLNIHRPTEGDSITSCFIMSSPTKNGEGLLHKTIKKNSLMSLGSRVTVPLVTDEGDTYIGVGYTFSSVHMLRSWYFWKQLILCIRNAAVHGYSARWFCFQGPSTWPELHPSIQWHSILPSKGQRYFRSRISI